MPRPETGRGAIDPDASPCNIGLFYDDDAYTEPAGVLGETGRPPDAASGLMGRHVAGRSFLDAYLTHGRWDDLAVLVRRRDAADSLARFCRDHPSSRTRPRRLRAFEERNFHRDFAADPPPARLLYFPTPVSARHAWARQRLGPAAFALAGVTHTLCSAEAVRQIGELVTAPFEPHDALICTSAAVARMVRDVAGTYADHLRERHGGNPGLNLRLEVIPLGVDADRFRPPTPAERQAGRAAFGVGEDEVAVLFVGRLSHHAKAHPFPMYRAADLAARATGRPVRLLLAGWAANRAIADAFVEGARAFAPGVRATFLDGHDPAVRAGVWRAADAFVSLVDNIQETFGLVVAEAMASGLPVVASDWDGYRDLVDDGRTGFLVPTTALAGADGSATSRLMFGELDYDHFLAECGQTITVDVAAAAEALARLVSDEPLRRSLGDAGRRRAVERFAWPRVIAAYESLWRDQGRQRLGSARRGPAPDAPAHYPPLARSFAGYPTRWLDPAGPALVSASGTAVEMERLLDMPLTHHVADRRVADPSVLRRVLAEARAARPLADLDALLRASGADPTRAAATLAWMLKYDLLRLVP